MKKSVGQRVGLDTVQMPFGLYVFGHLTKWFVFVLMFKFWSVCLLCNCRPSISYKGFRLYESKGLEVQILLLNNYSNET
jgi:hypothetical protein